MLVFLRPIAVYKFQDQHSILSRMQTAFSPEDFQAFASIQRFFSPPSDLGVFLKTLGADFSFDMGTTLPFSLTSLQGETELHHLISILVSH